TDEVLHFDGTTGAFIDVAASDFNLSGPVGIAFGPDGYLYISSVNSSQILQFDVTTGAPPVGGAPGGVFVDSGAELIFPTGLIFGPDGNLYVASLAGNVLRYNGATGDFIDEFVKAADNAGLTSPNFLA